MTSGLSYVRSVLPVAPEQLTVAGVLERAAGRAPDRTAFLFRSNEPDANLPEWTYAELLDKARRTGRFLAQRFAHGTRVAIWAPTRPEWLLFQLGAAYAGVVIVAISPAAAPRELHYMLAQSEASALVYLRRYRGTDRAEVIAGFDPLPHLRETIEIDDLIDRIAQVPDDVPLPQVVPDDWAMIQYTSGTTGLPKGAIVTHRSVCNTSWGANNGMEMAEGSRWLNNLPMYNTAGSVNCVLCLLWNVGTQIMLSQFEPGLVLKAIREDRPHWLPLVPTMILALMGHPDFASTDFSCAEVVETGGAPVPPELVQTVEERFGADCIVVFGQTELSGVLSMTRRNDTIEHRCKTIGYPLGGMEARIADPETGEIVPLGSQGEIQVRGHSVTQGYYNMPEATAGAIDPEGWLRTGDLGQLDPDGYMRITGRLKEMIIRGGSNVYPREIEDALSEHPDIALCAVFGLPHEKYGESVAIAVVPRAGRTPVDLDGLREYLASRIAPFKIPTSLFYVDEMPMSPMGKIQKFALRDQFSKTDA